MSGETNALGPERLPALARLVNAHARLVPPGWDFTPGLVEGLITGAESLWCRHYPQDRESAERATWRTSVVARDGRLLAAARWMRPARDDSSLSPESRDTAFVQWMVSEPRSPDSAEALALDVVREAAEAGCGRVDVTSRNAFGLGWLGVPDAWPHVIEGLARAGFAERERWVVFHARTEAGDPSPPPGPCDVDWVEDPEMDEWKLSVRQRGALVGECEAWGVPDHLKDLPGAAEWVTVEFIGVEEPFHRRGWGRWLLREQLRRQAELGRRRAILWTESGNRPMLGLLDALGFERGPDCVCMARDI